jgi:hypothetical protein
MIKTMRRVSKTLVPEWGSMMFSSKKLVRTVPLMSQMNLLNMVKPEGNS